MTIDVFQAYVLSNSNSCYRNSTFYDSVTQEPWGEICYGLEAQGLRSKRVWVLGFGFKGYVVPQQPFSEIHGSAKLEVCRIVSPSAEPEEESGISQVPHYALSLGCPGSTENHPLLPNQRTNPQAPKKRKHKVPDSIPDPEPN